MKALIIGGTGTISTAVVQRAAEQGWDLTIINRGNRNEELPAGVEVITADMNDPEDVRAKLRGRSFDTVCEFIGFVRTQVERDFNLFNGICGQYMYISSASAYHKPVKSLPITEGTALANPYWQYSRDKIACEDYLMTQYRDHAFPVTIIRPSHTYGLRSVPLGLHGKAGSFQVIKRMQEGKPVLIHGDGSSLWTMTFNTDFANGFVGLMGNPHAVGEAFQITGDESLTWNQIYETIAHALGVKLHPYHVASDFLAAVGQQYDYNGSLLGDKAASVLFDNSKLKRAVPYFRTEVRFEQGVAKTLAYVLSHPECQKEDPAFDTWCDRVIAVQEEARTSF